MNYYNSAIANLITELNHYKENLIDNLFQIAITGELKDWAETVDIGEYFFFSRELFESLDDNKVKVIISFLDYMESMVAELQKC